MNQANYVYQETTTDKLFNFLKKNIYNFLIVIVCFVFLFREMIEISESGKTIPSIIADSFISFLMGFTLDTIFSRKGIEAAKNSVSYMALMETYGKEISKTDPYIDKLDDWCEEKNEENLIKAQKQYLRKARIKYEDFAVMTKEECCKTKEQKKFWKKAENVKIRKLSADNLLLEMNTQYDKGKKEQTILEYEKSQDFKKIISKVLLSVIFGYFTITYVRDFGQLLWGAINLGCWILLALTRYTADYMYVKEVHQNVIRRKINLLIEFNNSVKGGKQNG